MSLVEGRPCHKTGVNKIKPVPGKEWASVRKLSLLCAKGRHMVFGVLTG